MAAAAGGIKVTQQAKIELAAHRHNFAGFEQLKVTAAAGLATVIVCLFFTNYCPTLPQSFNNCAFLCSTWPGASPRKL